MAISPTVWGTVAAGVALPGWDAPARPRPGGDEGVVNIADLGLNGRGIPPIISGVPTDDVDLAWRLRARDAAALATLYDRHAAAVHGLFLSILRDPRLAEEATHDVFLGLWQRPDSFDAQRGTFSGWLLRVARNRAIDLLRRQREHPFPSATFDDGVAIDPMERLVDPDPDPANLAMGLVVQEDVRAALTHLAPDQSHLLYLVYFEGFTQREIATRLHRPLGTVKSQIRVAMKRLADLLAGPPPLTEHPPLDVPALSVRPVAAGRPVRGHLAEDVP
ncbi:MAG: sigma-70 family RNA polymerase sigma factor [Chloroflexota bacterium]|nr:sigma-70 family RNA polymerase sigma factor [Chloroflexota bacterium]